MLLLAPGSSAFHPPRHSEHLRLPRRQKCTSSLLGGIERHILGGKKEKKCEVLSITLDFHTLQLDFLKQINENLFFHLKPMSKASRRKMLQESLRTNEIRAALAL